MTKPNTYFYSFEDYIVDPNTLNIYKNGTKINLNRIRTAILISLLDHAGEIVTREEIVRTVWPEKTELKNLEAVLSQQIFQLRRFFHDNSRSPRYILTIPGTGYTFYPPVEVLASIDTASLDNKGLTQECLNDYVVLERPESADISTSRSARRKPISTLRKVGDLLCHPNLQTVYHLLLIAGTIIIWSSLVRWWLVMDVKGQTSRASSISPLISRAGRKGDLAYSRDGRLLAFIDEGAANDTFDLFVRNLNSTDILQLTNDPLQEKMITWSPDSKQIAFLRWLNNNARKYAIFTVPAFGGPERYLGEAIDGLDWDPTGRYVAISDDEGAGTPTGIYLLSLDGRERRLVSSPAPQSRESGINLFDTEPKFSPDGEEIAFIRWSSGSSGALLVADRQGKQIRQLTFEGTEIRSPQWTSNGREILFISNRSGSWRIWRISKYGGEAQLVEKLVADIASFSLSPDMKSIAYTERFDDSELQVHKLSHPDDRTDNEFDEFPCSANSTRSDHSPHFSPDGGMIVFVSRRTGVDELWIMDADCQNPRQLTRFKANGVGSPQWSPNGEEIVFDFVSDKKAELYKIDLIGSQTSRLTNNNFSDFLPSWSSDGQWIYFMSERPGENPPTQVWRVRNDGRNEQQVTKHGGREPVASVDGKRLFFIRDDRLWVKDLRTGGESRIEPLSRYRFDRYWALVQNTIYFLSPELQMRSSLNSFDLRTGRITKIHEVTGSQVSQLPGLSISPDRRRMVVSMIDKKFCQHCGHYQLAELNIESVEPQICRTYQQETRRDKNRALVRSGK